MLVAMICTGSHLCQIQDGLNIGPGFDFSGVTVHSSDPSHLVLAKCDRPRHYCGGCIQDQSSPRDLRKQAAAPTI